MDSCNAASRLPFPRYSSDFADVTSAAFWAIACNMAPVQQGQMVRSKGSIATLEILSWLGAGKEAVATIYSLPTIGALESACEIVSRFATIAGAIARTRRR